MVLSRILLAALIVASEALVMPAGSAIGATHAAQVNCQMKAEDSSSRREMLKAALIGLPLAGASSVSAATVPGWYLSSRFHAMPKV